MQDFKKQIQKTHRTLAKKARALERTDNRRIILNAACLGTYGWHMSVPVFTGVILGRFLDEHTPLAHVSWTLTLIIAGTLIGFYNANKWLQKAGKPPRREDG